MDSLDTKFVYELTEHEMARYVDRLHQRDLMRRERYINEVVENVVRLWSEARQRGGTYAPNCWTFNLTTSAGWRSPNVGELGTMPPASSMTLKDVAVKAYPWMKEEEVRYIVREQLIEQMEDDLA